MNLLPDDVFPRATQHIPEIIDIIKKMMVNGYAYRGKDGSIFYDVFWKTELGKGRPGWHIECSAMSTKHLGTRFDIHVGGVDNIYPHHETVIAQNFGAFGEKPSKYWLHARHLMIDGKKMSKSAGNFFTLRDLLEKKYDTRRH